MDPDTPVYVEWYTYRHIPRTRHAVIVPYDKALKWAKEGATIQVWTIDGNLFEELTRNGAR